MKNHQHEMLEIIDGFKNLTYKIKKDNDQIKDSIKNKDETIKLCKSEYQKLYAQYKDLEKRYDELEAYILEQQQQQQQQQQQENLKQEQQQQQQQQQQQYKQILLYLTKKRKRYVMSHDDADEQESDDDDTEENNDFEYVKIKKTKPKRKVKKKEK